MTTRREAAETGNHKYHTGRPCRNGHLTYRYTKTGGCAACIQSYARRYSNLIKNGHEIVSFKIHPEDVKTVREFVEALNSARRLAL